MKWFFPEFPLHQVNFTLEYGHGGSLTGTGYVG